MKQWVRRRKSLIILYKIWQNQRLKKRIGTAVVETGHGASHAKKSLAQSISYINEQFNDYVNYGDLRSENLVGKVVLELGFGDNVGVALRFLVAGAKQVVCVDKFYSTRDTVKEREIYLALRDTLNVEEKKSFDEVIDLSKGIEIKSDRLRIINGLDLASGPGALADVSPKFDLVLSRAVIEEIYEPEKLFGTLDEVLAPGGLMLHKIDLTDYGVFSEVGMHPLTFLTIPTKVYRLMATNSGIPNRKLIRYYQNIMEVLKYEARFLITSLVGSGHVNPHRDLTELDRQDLAVAGSLIKEIRPRLASEFKNLSDQELTISGIFLIARKPAAVSAGRA